MKTALLFCAAFLLVTSSLFAKEINWRDISWDEAKQAAAKEHKYIFVDALTEWCGWCKVLDKKTFTDEAVIEFMNANYICLKLDMERGFGRILGMKYRVQGYPSQLVFSSTGKLVYFNAGYAPPEAFMVTLKKSVDPNEHLNTPGVSDKIDLDFPAFYGAAHDVNGKRTFPDTNTVAAYLDTQKDLFSEINWSVLFKFPLTQKYTAYVLDNAARFASLYGEREVNEKIAAVINRRAAVAGKANDADAFARVLADVDTYFPAADRAPEKRFLRQQFYQTTKNWTAYAAVAEEVLTEAKFASAEQINQYCWTLYEKCDDPAVIAKAVSWMQKAVAIDTGYANLDTYASLLFKNKNFADAEKYAQQAIAAGKTEGANVESTQELLHKIEKSLGKGAQ